jgi:hypothetical protein
MYSPISSFENQLSLKSNHSYSCGRAIRFLIRFSDFDIAAPLKKRKTFDNHQMPFGACTIRNRS